MRKYEIIIYWSNEDDTYVAAVPELPGCMAHGATYESAAANANEAIQRGLILLKNSAIRFRNRRDNG